MSDPPENQGKMHDLVQAYARKRQAEADAGTGSIPSEMPASTRARLQDAVRQQFTKTAAPKPDSESPGSLLSRWLPYLPRLAFALGLLMMLALAARLLVRNETPRETAQLAKQAVPAPSSSGQGSAQRPFSSTSSEQVPAEPYALQPAEPRPTAPAPVPPATTPAPAQAPQASLADARPLPRRLAPSDVRLQVENEAAVPARRDEATRTESRLRENPAVLTFNAPASSATQKKTASASPLEEQLATANLKAADGSAPTPRGAATPAAPAAKLEITTQLAAAAEANRRAPANRVVLANFELIQAGTQLRFIDSDDGSVYEGQFATSREKRSNLADKDSETVRAQLETTRLPVNGQDSVGATKLKSLDAQVPRAWPFRVSGTNRSLQERVELEGVLLSAGPSNASSPTGLLRFSQNLSTSSLAVARFYRTQPTQFSAPSASPRNETDALSALPTNLVSIQRIQGTLRVGSTNLTQIDAYRVGR
jgi:hypothetical protein